MQFQIPLEIFCFHCHGSCIISVPATTRETRAPRAGVVHAEGNRYIHSLGCYCLPFCFAKGSKSPRMTSESACQKILCKLANHMGLYLEQTTEKREVFSSSVVWINCLTLRHKIVKWLVHSDEVWNWRKPIMYQNWSMQGKKCCVFLCRHVLKKTGPKHEQAHTSHLYPLIKLSQRSYLVFHRIGVCKPYGCFQLKISQVLFPFL